MQTQLQIESRSARPYIAPDSAGHHQFFLNVARLHEVTMATANTSGKGLIVLSLGALLVLVMMAQPSQASSFVFFGGPCSGNSAILNPCGCSNIPANTRGGYSFEYNGQTAKAYNCQNCNCGEHTSFDTSTGQCTGFGWQSVFIQC